MSSLQTSLVESTAWARVSQVSERESAHRADADAPAEPSRQPIVCVLGMHRSGTSLATRILNLLGIHLGPVEHLIGSRPDNPKGFWECEPIVDLNTEILERHGGNWHEPPSFPAGWETAAELADLRQKARTLLASYFAVDNWGWKDPRTCLTLEFWKQLLPPMHYVICLRSPAEVAESLTKRDGFSTEKSIRLWQSYTGEAIEHTAGLVRHFIFYEDLIHSHREEVSRLARFVGRHDALEQPALSSAIDSFIDTDHYHNRTSFLNTLDDPKVLFPAKALYFALRSATRSGGASHKTPGKPGWDSLGEQVWPLFSRCSRRAQAEWNELSRSRAECELRIAESSAEIQGLRASSRILEESNHRLTEERDQALAVARDLRAGLDEQEVASQGLAQEIANCETELAGLRAERATLERRIEEDRQAREAEIAAVQARLDATVSDNLRLTEERNQAESIGRELRADLDEREIASQELAREISRRDAELAALSGERAALEQRLHDDRRARKAEMETSRARIDVIANDNRRLTDERDRAVVVARELRVDLSERDRVVASLASRMADLLETCANRNEVSQELQDAVHNIGGQLAGLTGQLGALTAECAHMASRDVARDSAIRESRERLSERQDEIQAVISRLSGTVDYMGMVRRVRAYARRLLPPEARIIVISKGDPDLVELEGQEGWHFPQDDLGNYAGHYPAESEEAIAHLEALKARGAGFLVVPSSASWWLEHYTGLARHLDTSYQRIWKSEDCQIYELAGSDRSRRHEPCPRQTIEASPTLQAVDLTRPVAADRCSIRATCDMPGPNPVSIGPGHLRVRGWALSMAGIEGVSAFVDGLPREQVAYGTARFDVEAAHPEFPNAHHSGFVGKIDLQGLLEGEHSLVIQVRSTDGGQMELIRSFRLEYDALPDRGDINADYPAWLARRLPSESDLARMQIEGMKLTYQPVISLVVPAYNTPEEYLSLMVDSVMAQTYTKWELCVANGGSTAPHMRPFLTSLAKKDARVKVIHLPQNQGISVHSNAALSLATGEFVGLLDSDDVLMPFALFEVVRALNDAPATDLIYSDEDKTDDTVEDRWEPFFKPDWSPDLLLCNNYICHFGVYRRSLVEAIGGFRPEYDGSQDYDLVLRFTERTNRIVHLPSILYSWRAIPGSTARDMMAKPYAVDAGRRAVEDALRRRGVAGRVEPGYSLGQWHVRYDLHGQPAVTVVIPAGGNVKCLQACLDSVLERSTYSNLHVLVTDDSDATAVADLCRDLSKRDSRLNYRRFRLEPFNYSAINNSAVSVVDSPYVVLLNDDITVLAPDWVEAMLEHAQRPEVGVVGARLLYHDRSLQHAGVIMGPHQNCGHAFKHFSEDDPGYFSLARVIRNCSAVTFACAMMRRSVFNEVGGLDAQNLAVAYNDVDMCLRIRERGYWVVYTPYAELFHHESATRKMHCNPGEDEYIRRRWAGSIRHDPFYNPNLTREATDYSLNFDAPTVAERLGPIEDGAPTARRGHDNGLEAGFSPTLVPNGEIAPDQAGDRLTDVSSKTRIDMMKRTVAFGRHIQGMAGRWGARFNDLFTRRAQQASPSSPERGAGGDESAGRGVASNDVNVALGPLPTAELPARDFREGLNGFRSKRNSYPQVRRRIRELVNAELPTDAVVAVVSRGDSTLLQLGPRQGWHFPRTEAGVYAGFHPADSEEAITHLEELRRKGADYLLFPSTAFWWLGFYGDFQKYLESHYPCICSDPSCLIFQL
jgi:GT2 family glycosyltransferase